MPNHVTNRLTFPAGVLDSFIGDDDGQPTFDFEQIIPMPACISKDSSSLQVKNAAEIALGLIDFTDQTSMPTDPIANMGDATEVLHHSNCLRQLTKGPMPKDFSDADFEAFIGMLRAWKETGHFDWYDWSIANWGTKWNAYSAKKFGSTVLEFDTAWSAPHPVIKALVSKTNCGLRHEWADEDTGNNVGFIEYDEAGEIFQAQELSGTKEGYELAFELSGGQEYYRWDGTKYVCIED